ncbi:MAG: hypothetical protein HOQ21_17260 [Dermatophilaceae bacterium]|nr:hypothetical protein [Dermatophilaceae bacterium]
MSPFLVRAPGPVRRPRPEGSSDDGVSRVRIGEPMPVTLDAEGYLVPA